MNDTSVHLLETLGSRGCPAGPRKTQNTNRDDVFLEERFLADWRRDLLLKETLYEELDLRTHTNPNSPLTHPSPPKAKPPGRPVIDLDSGSDTAAHRGNRFFLGNQLKHKTYKKIDGRQETQIFFFLCRLNKDGLLHVMHGDGEEWDPRQ